MLARRFAFDIRPLAYGPSGDRTHLRDLLRELPILAPEHEYVLCLNREQAPDIETLLARPNVRLCRLFSRPGWLWTPLIWPAMLWRQKIDAAHAVYLVPPWAPCPTIVTIHDVSFLAHPDWFPARPRRIMQRLIPLSARRATRIVTGSVYAATEIARYCHVPREKIVVIPYGVRPPFPLPDRQAARAYVAERYGLKSPFLLAVGLLQPRKNIIRLLEAFALLAETYPELQLAIVGAAGWGLSELQARLEALQIRPRVVLCGSTPDEDLWQLYRAATIFVYPSLYEGFGLPPLEAMACGTPVVASNVTAIPEVVGDAALLCDPTNPHAIAEALAAILKDGALAERLARAGLQRAAQFTWRRTAEMYLALLCELSER